MKQLSTVLNGILVVAVIILFVLHFTDSDAKKSSAVSGNESVEQEDFSVAYINTDSLLLNYTFAKEVNEQLMNKEESSRADFNEKLKVFQQDAVAFQKKVENNGFLSLDRATKEQERLARAERSLQELNQKLSNDLRAEQNKLNRQLRDTLMNYLDEYVKENPYKVILSNTLGDNVLYDAEGINITQEIIDALNERHAASK